jgi:hypothetical protein
MNADLIQKSKRYTRLNMPFSYVEKQMWVAEQS